MKKNQDSLFLKKFLITFFTGDIYYFSEFAVCFLKGRIFNILGAFILSCKDELGGRGNLLFLVKRYGLPLLSSLPLNVSLKFTALNLSFLFFLFFHTLYEKTRTILLRILPIPMLL